MAEAIILLMFSLLFLTERRFKIRCYSFTMGLIRRYRNLSIFWTKRRVILSNFDDFRFLMILLFIPDQTQIEIKMLLFYYGFDTTLSKFVDLSDQTQSNFVDFGYFDFWGCIFISNQTSIQNKMLLFYYVFDTTLSKFVNLLNQTRG